MNTKSWQHKEYESSLKETERNISSLKYHLEERLKKQLSSTKIQNNHDLSSTYPNSLQLKHGLYSSFNSPTKFANTSSVATPQTSLLTSLMKRIEEQSRTISHLSDTVKLQSEEISNLNRVYRDLEQRCYGGVDSSIIERNLQNIYRELRNDIDKLHAQLRSGRSVNVDNCDSSRYQNEVSRNLSMQKRMIEDETDAIRREINSLKNRIQKIEGDFDSSSRNTQEITRRCNDVERNVSSVCDEHRKKCCAAGDRRENDIKWMKKELKELSSILNRLHRKKQPSPSFAKESPLKYSQADEESASHRRKSTSFKEKYEFDDEEELIDHSFITTLLSGSADANSSIESLTLDVNIKEPSDGGGDDDEFSSLKFDRLSSDGDIISGDEEELNITTEADLEIDSMFEDGGKFNDLLLDDDIDNIRTSNSDFEDDDFHSLTNISGSRNKYLDH